MEIRIKRTEDYIPKWEGNDKSPKPMVFHLKHLTTEEFNDCHSISPIKLDIKGKKIGGGEVFIDRKKMFLYAVLCIDDFTITDENDKPMKIKTGEDMLHTPGLETLFFEVMIFIRGMEAKVNTKN